MTVSSYLYQTPYSQPVQVGRPDPAASKSQSEETQQQNEQTVAAAQTLQTATDSNKTSELVSKASSYESGGSSTYAMSTQQLLDLAGNSANTKISANVQEYGN